MAVLPESTFLEPSFLELPLESWPFLDPVDSNLVVEDLPNENSTSGDFSYSKTPCPLFWLALAVSFCLGIFLKLIIRRKLRNPL